MNPDVFITIALAGPVILAGLTVALVLLTRYRAAQSTPETTQLTQATRAELSVNRGKHAAAR